MQCMWDKNLLNHPMDSALQMTQEDKTDPESEASVGAPRDEASHMFSGAAPDKKKRRRRRRRGRRRKSDLTTVGGRKSDVTTIIRPSPLLLVHPKIPQSFPFIPDAKQVGAPQGPYPPGHWAAIPFGQDRHLALDCEMVGVGPFGRRSVLARVSMVNWTGQVVLDTFVKVTEPVTDYRTFVSGIRPSDLESPHAMDFGECRLLVHQMLKDKVLVGHGLENDLKVLHLSHPWHQTRDTATYEPFMKGGGCYGVLRPRRLKELAESQLGISIQGEEHDSIEDARCAMELYKRVQQSWDGMVEWKRNMEAKICAY